MALFLLIVVGVLLIGVGVMSALWWVETGRRMKAERLAAQQLSEARTRVEDLQSEVSRLAGWAAVGDAETQARQILSAARETLNQAQSDARVITNDAHARATLTVENLTREAQAKALEASLRAKQAQEEASRMVDSASARGRMIVDEAEAKAKAIAGDALEAVQNAAFYRRTAEAMRNTIKGYGDEYLVPPSSFLDTLAEQYSHKEAGQELRLARARTKQLIKDDKAAACEYVESSRREGASNFVLDAFNGKVDSILSRVKDDNAGKLGQEIRDAFQLVNFGGKAFCEARITDEYLSARLDELKWAATAQLLRKEEAEEQRRIREQMRDEARALREYEREIRESAKEEDLLRKAMAKAEARIAEATAEERAKFEAQLAELQQKVAQAEQRNQRALSMAQQTKRGNVYIISNVGSFGENVYKIGMTRRLDPMDRIWELGDSSVPFDFDVHAFISCEDAPALECRLHHHFVLNQINKVNYRKEFFRANLADIRKEIEALGIGASWTMTSEAREYRESQAIEEKISKDPAAKEAWIKRQLTLDPTDFAEAELVEEAVED